MFKRKRIFCIALLFLNLSIFVAPLRLVSAKDSPLAVAVDRAIDSAIKENRVVGCVVLVSQDGKLIYERAAGLADREKEIPMREDDTFFRLASVSKAFTSMAAASLIDKGKLGLDDPVTKYLPDFQPKLPDGTTPKITIRQLMSHTSGLNYSFFEPKDGPYHKAGVSDGLDSSGLTLEENLRRIASAPLLFEPGSKWQYSLATDVLGAVVAKANGTTLPEAMWQHVTDPLDMSYAGFVLPEGMKDSICMSTPYFNGEKEPIRMNDPQEFSGVIYSPNRIFDANEYPSGGAGMAGTASDVMSLLEAIRTNQLAGPEIMREMDKDQTGGKGPGPGVGFGLGWSVVLDPKAAKTPQSKGTIAWSGAYGHHWFVDREKKLSVVIMTNTAFEGMNGKITTDIRDAVYGQLLFFEDSFQGKLQDGWSWIRETPDNYRFKDGALEIKMEPNPAEGIRNILVRKAPKVADGPFTVQLEVDSDKPFSNQFQQVGIYWLKGEELKFKFVKEFIDGELYVFPGKKPLNKQRVTLRLVVDGRKITAWFKPDGATEFQKASEATLPERSDEDRIAIQCWHGPANDDCWTRLETFQILK